MRVLFICKYNIGRSQIAEAFFNMLSKHEGISAGTDALDNSPVNEFVIQCMAEENIDVSLNRAKKLTSKLVESADKIIVLSDIKELPKYIDKSKVIVWEIPDAKGSTLEFHRKVRDKIKDKIEDLVERIG